LLPGRSTPYTCAMKAAATPIDGLSQFGANAAPRRPLVWIVDDSPLEAEAARRALSPECETEIFTDGSAVLERGAHAPLPDVLVLDWVMPGISGVEVCRFLRAKHDQLPVLLLTVNRATEHLIEGLAAGANDFVPKPFAAPELAARVRALFQTRLLRERIEQGERERAEAERQRADAAEERARMNELYLAAIGHDLRNPVSAIAMTARVIDSQTKDEHLRKLARNIETSSRQMFEMIGALLDVTRMRLGGGIAVEPRRDSLGRVCRQVVDELAAVHPQRQMLL
jgi:DNA-binding response OmpR family regulator